MLALPIGWGWRALMSSRFRRRRSERRPIKHIDNQSIPEALDEETSPGRARLRGGNLYYTSRFAFRRKRGSLRDSGSYPPGTDLPAWHPGYAYSRECPLTIGSPHATLSYGSG